VAGLYFAAARYTDAIPLYQRNERSYREAGYDERARLSAELFAAAQEDVRIQRDAAERRTHP
jgi:hypothetical protein